ncbi:MAG: glycine--tRNA ligase, partial [Candidatus Diapherotrites archaeon]|nr:glycine--tRNA ligase [Candidatus Diapherotrites archaeon]
LKSGKDLVCPNCGAHDWSDAKVFNLMFKTHQGVIEDQTTQVYLRPETAQGIFVNFKNILDSCRVRVPFGIGQIGKAFRNEITPGNFLFRTVEFDLMEFEYFIRPEAWEKTFDEWLKEMHRWLDFIGMDQKHTRVREHTKDELSHYSKRTVDIEYQTPFGWKEMYGLAYRTDFDLKNHMEKSGEDLNYFDPETNEKFIPHVIEPTFGWSRTFLFLLLEAYTEEEVKDAKGATETRVVLKLDPKIAPYKAAILPLMKKPELMKVANEIFADLSPSLAIDMDITGSIGKRYRRQDEIGTPKCVTVDFDTLEDQSVTIRDRDTMKQVRVKIADLKGQLTPNA